MSGRAGPSQGRRRRWGRLAGRGADDPAEGFLQLGRRARFEGELGGSGLALVHGVLLGAVDLDGDLIVAEDGQVREARGRAVRLRVEGRAEGSLRIETAIEVASTGVLEGDLESSEIQAPAGARIEAQLRIVPPAAGPAKG